MSYVHDSFYIIVNATTFCYELIYVYMRELLFFYRLLVFGQCGDGDWFCVKERERERGGGGGRMEKSERRRERGVGGIDGERERGEREREKGRGREGGREVGR